MARIVITRRMHGFVRDELLRHHLVWQNPSQAPVSRAILLKRVSGCEGLLCMPYDSIDAELIDSAPDLLTISTYSVGYDHVDVRHAVRKGISVGHTPDVLSEATANMAIALILDATRGVSRGDREVRAGRWRHSYAPEQMCGSDLSGKTLGILGMGRIGTLVARRAAALGMNVTYHSRHRLAAGAERGIGAKYKSMRSLLSGCDVLSVHVPHTAKTHHMINAGSLSLMRPGSYLVNTSRGAVVDEKSLVRAVKSGRIAGAGLDVFESEPVGRKNPLLGLENVTLVPHLGSATRETRFEMARIALENLKAGLCKRPVPYAVPLKAV